MPKIPRRPLLEGLQRALPIMLGYLPVGFAFGVLAVKNDIPPSLVVGLAVLHFSGSGQFVFASLWGAGAGILSTVVAVFIINLRYLLMSAALLPWLSRLPRWQRFFLGLGITDENFAVHVSAFQRGWPLSIATLFACNTATHASWVVGCAIGAFFGEFVADVRPLGLDYAITAMFLALLVPQCASGLHVLVAVFALGLSVAFKIMGMGQWNIALATILGASLGTCMAGRFRPQSGGGA